MLYLNNCHGVVMDGLLVLRLLETLTFLLAYFEMRSITFHLHLKHCISFFDKMLFFFSIHNLWRLYILLVV